VEGGCVELCMGKARGDLGDPTIEAQAERLR